MKTSFFVMVLLASPAVAQDVPPKGLLKVKDIYAGCLAAASVGSYDAVPEAYRPAAMACMTAAGLLLQWGQAMGICRGEQTTIREAVTAFVQFVDRAPHLRPRLF